MPDKKPLALHWKIIIGLVLGVIFAVLSAQFGWSEFTKDWIAPFGSIFIKMLKMVAVPMVLFSIIAGVISLGDPSSLGRMGLKTLGMYLVTTIFACSVGLLIVNVWKPGERLDETQRTENRIRYEVWVENTEGVDVLDGTHLLDDTSQADLIARVRDEMGAEAPDAKVQSKLDIAAQEKDAGPLKFVVDLVPDNIGASLTNNKLMLQVIFFAILFGITLLTIPRDRAQPVIDVVHGLGDVYVKMVTIIMNGAPFFVFALLAGTMSDLAGDDPKKVLDIFAGLAHYSGAVAIGLLLMLSVVYPILARLITKMPIKRFTKGILPAQMMAFSTSSSVATLPVTLGCVQNNLGVDKKTTSFVLPIGATVNMDGTSLYQAVAVVFMAQMHMVDLSTMQQFTIVLTATLASIGAAAVPSAGLVLMIAVLESVGLNPAWIAIIFPVDRILDMIRTMVNVTGDATVSSVIAYSEGRLNLDAPSPPPSEAPPAPSA